MSFSDTARETTSPEIAEIAARGVKYPERLSTDEVQRVCASALTQTEDRRQYGPDDESHREAEAEARGAAAAYAACAVLVRAAGCLCESLSWGLDSPDPDFNGEVNYSLNEPVIRHDSRCPIFLATAIEARAKAPSPEVTDV